jgi:hypothetical protein
MVSWAERLGICHRGHKENKTADGIDVLINVETVKSEFQFVGPIWLQMRFAIHLFSMSSVTSVAVFKTCA